MTDDTKGSKQFLEKFGISSEKKKTVDKLIENSKEERKAEDSSKSKNWLKKNGFL